MAQENEEAKKITEELYYSFPNFAIQFLNSVILVIFCLSSSHPVFQSAGRQADGETGGRADQQTDKFESQIPKNESRCQAIVWRRANLINNNTKFLYL